MISSLISGGIGLGLMGVTQKTVKSIKPKEKERNPRPRPARRFEGQRSRPARRFRHPSCIREKLF